MSPALSFTAKDVCAALGGVSRSQVHAWTQMPPWSRMPTRERSARRYNQGDLLTLAVIQTLEEQFGVKSRQLTRVSAGIHHYLQTPRRTGGEELVFILLRDSQVRPIQARPVNEPGWVIDVARERERIDVYLDIAPPQRELPLITGVDRSAR